MDATGTERAVLVVAVDGRRAVAAPCGRSIPERVERMAFIAPALPLPPAVPRSRRDPGVPRAARRPTTVGGSVTATTGVEHYEDFLEFFFAQCLTEPHSTKPHDDTVGWGLETDAATLVATQLAPRLQDEADVRALLSRIDCPILVIHGSDDHVRPWESGARLAELADGKLAVLEGSGHLPHARDPVKVNLLLRDFIGHGQGVMTTVDASSPPAGRRRRPGRPADDDRHREAPDGVRIAFDVYGAGDPTLVLLPSAPIVHSRQWKGQVPYLSRHFRVVTFDGRGNGRSDRPTDPAAYTDARITDDIVAVMDATGTARAILVGLCGDGVWRAVRLAATDPTASPASSPSPIGVPRLSPPHPGTFASSGSRTSSRVRGLGQGTTGTTGARDYPGFVRFFFEAITYRAAFDQGDRRRRRVGARRLGRRDARRRRRRRSTCDQRGRRGDLPRPCAARCSSSTAPRTTASRSPAPIASPS